ncbi:hypothetical protein BFS06_12240 [Clostridium perfringens]|uniref:Uncharacterized protein n=1 Tax=Clostridium perfringens TaxID=1502 RepID=A0A140GR15_CLOPF|nr:hypothetical protein [Clostridium perfringens]AMN30974.1 hypothetical protein JFP838_pA0058 [Clostridium perfringens]TBX14970.1 hypothetical protein BFS06_12240 [Clostridium perfringens]
MNIKVNRLVVENNILVEKFYNSFNSLEEADNNLKKLNKKTSKKGIEVYRLLASKKNSKAIMSFVNKKNVIVMKYIFI